MDSIGSAFLNYYNNRVNLINIFLQIRRQELGIPPEELCICYVSEEQLRQIVTFKINKVILIIVIYEGIKCTIIYGDKKWNS